MSSAQVVPIVDDRKLTNVLRAHAQTYGGLQTVETIRLAFSDLSDMSFNNEHKQLSGYNNFSILDETRCALTVLVKRLRRMYGNGD